MKVMSRLSWTLLVTLPLVAFAATKFPDESFYKAAAEGGLAEVQQGQLAADKGQSQAVKDFGSQMVRDHSAVNQQLKAVAATKGIDLPTSPSLAQVASIEKLKVLSGDTFDKSYIKGMVEDHQKDIAAFQKEAQSGQDPDAKSFANAALPTLKMHLAKIRAIASAAGLDAK